MNTNTSLIKLFAALLAALIPVVAHANPGDLYATGQHFDSNTCARWNGEYLCIRPAAPSRSGFLTASGISLSRLSTPRLYLMNRTDSQIRSGWDSHSSRQPFGFPIALAFDGAGNLYAATLNHLSNDLNGGGRILKITPSGLVSTFVHLNPARFHQNFGVAVDEQNNLFVSDNLHSVIYLITPGRRISTFVSTLGPSGLAFDGAGNLYASYGGLNSANRQASLKLLPMEHRLSSFRDWRTFVVWLSTPMAIFCSRPRQQRDLQNNSAGSVSIFATGLNVPNILPSSLSSSARKGAMRFASSECWKRSREMGVQPISSLTPSFTE